MESGVVRGMEKRGKKLVKHFNTVALFMDFFPVLGSCDNISFSFYLPWYELHHFITLSLLNNNLYKKISGVHLIYVVLPANVDLSKLFPVKEPLNNCCLAMVMLRAWNIECDRSGGVFLPDG